MNAMKPFIDEDVLITIMVTCWDMISHISTAVRSHKTYRFSGHGIEKKTILIYQSKRPIWQVMLGRHSIFIKIRKQTIHILNPGCGCLHLHFNENIMMS